MVWWDTCLGELAGWGVLIKMYKEMGFKMSIHGPLVNNQVPPVNSDDILCRGFYIQQDPDSKNIYSLDGDGFVGAFDDATWGYGASGQVWINGRSLGIENKEKMQEIRSVRKKIEESYNTQGCSQQKRKLCPVHGNSLEQDENGTYYCVNADCTYPMFHANQLL